MPSRSSVTASLSMLSSPTLISAVVALPAPVPLQQQLMKETASQNTSNTHVNNNYNHHHQQQHTTVSYNKISPNVIASSNAMIVNESVPLTVAATATHATTTASINNNDRNQQRSHSANRTNSDSASEQNNMVDNNQPIKGRRMEGASNLKRTNNNDFVVTQSSANATNVMVDNGRMSDFVKPEKKHKGFLSRFSGFRFSLRGKKKPAKLFENNNAVINSEQPQRKGISGSVGFPNGNSGANRNGSNGTSGGGGGDSQRNSVNKTNDFIYIPLKDPVTGKDRSVDNSAGGATAIGPKSIVGDGAYGIHAPLYQRDSTMSSDKVDGHVLTTKPPLPRQPPRVVGVCAKPPSAAAVAVTTQLNGGSSSSRTGGGGGQRLAHAQRASSAPREIDVNDHSRLPIDHDDEIFYNQFRSDIMTSSHADGDNSVGYYSGGANISAVSDKPGKIIGDDGCEYKIGLIETNLDTHETIISGKTRSLMELGPQQMSVAGGQRHSSNMHHHHHHHPGRIATTVEPRRPHKSMEFLLDKENQQKVLVSTNIRIYFVV